MLQNTVSGRWHPILFRPAPLPGGKDSDLAAQRYRSLGHHTEGFATKEEAMAHIEASDKMEWRGLIWEWDGEGTPAMTEWFAPLQAA